jgi:phosphatidylserine decarboxylase
MVADTAIGALLAWATLLPLAWKWQLGVRRAAVVVLALALGSGLLVAATDVAEVVEPAPASLLVWLITVIASFALLAYRFYRDPDRQAPETADVVVSPADGEVIYVRHSRDGALPVATKGGRQYALEELTRTPLQSMNAIVVGISLSLMDVHVNRAPIGGRVTVQRHFKGSFGSLRRLESAFENERATTVIERGGLEIAVVLIASRLVRRITSYVEEGQLLTCGERIGAIRFGSQVDLVLPAEHGLVLHVKPGDRVAAGESVVAAIPPEPSPGDGLTGSTAEAESQRSNTIRSGSSRA